MVVLGIDACGVSVLYFRMNLLDEHPGLVELREIHWNDEKQEMTLEIWVKGTHSSSPVIHIADKKEYFHRKLKGFPRV
jgi:hypothetical protein